MDFALSTRLFVKERLNSHILDQILTVGIHQIEIFAARQHLNYYDRDHVRDVAQWFADHDVALHSVHGPLFPSLEGGRAGDIPISIAYLEKRQRIASMDEVKRALEIAERLPFRYLVLHLGLDGEEYDLRKFDAAGVDQVAFIQQAGRNEHAHICEALELFAGEVMGEFKEREAARVAKKAEELAPYVEAAFKRKAWMKPLADDEIPKVVALGRQIAEQGGAQAPAAPAQAQRAAASVAWREALEKAGD